MKNLKMLAAVACAAMISTGCSEHQSSFDIQDVPGRTALSGKIVYNQGTTLQNGQFVYDYKPAANLQVFVILNNSEYDGSLSGQTVLTTTTDDKGEYSFEIPAPLTGATATIRTADFEDVHHTIVRQDNKYVSREDKAIYSATDKIDIRSHGIVYNNLTCSHRIYKDTPMNCADYVVLKGILGRNCEVRTSAQPLYNENNTLVGYRNGSVDYCFEAAPSLDMIVTVNYGDYLSSQSFNVTTNTSGAYELKVPVEQFPASFTYTIDVLPTTNATFTHYVPTEVSYSIDGYERTYIDYQPVQLKGWLQQTESTVDNAYSASAAVPLDITPRDIKAAVFHPYKDNQDTKNYSASSFNSSCLWVWQL